MLDLNTFKTIVDNTPLISIDFIVKNSENKINIKVFHKILDKYSKTYNFQKVDKFASITDTYFIDRCI